MKKQFGVRLRGETVDYLNNFANEHKMSSTAAAEFFIKLGMESMQKNEQLESRIDKLEGQLSQVYQSLVKSSIYLTMQGAVDADKARLAGEQADKAVQKIFGENDE